MSRGFVKEGDQEEPPFIPPRAPLPAGVTNYVTPKGLELLERERDDLEQQLIDLKMDDEKEERHARTLLNGKIDLLNERIASARVVDLTQQPQEEVRFGAHVKMRNLQNKSLQEFQIVGVDEADVTKQKIAFVAPIARAVNGKRVGEVAQLNLGGEVRHLEILAIEYP